MSPKTLTGLELQLDDGPARESELFLVDGNNLAYRAFFALPEELATTEGFPTNALLGFTNMLFKLLSDYKPKGVAVAWDTRPVHRAAVAEAADVVYKEGRRPMADLLREQFPFFRPIVEAFGYRNLEFEGWEADDVIATLATRADEAGVRTCVVSTDRDAALFLGPSPAHDGFFSGSALFAYKINWQSVMFIGYGDDRELSDIRRLDPLDRQFFVKLSYAFQR